MAKKSRKSNNKRRKLCYSVASTIKRSLIASGLAVSMSFSMASTGLALNPGALPNVNSSENATITTTGNYMNILTNGGAGATSRILYNSYNIGSSSTVNYQFNFAHQTSINRVLAGGGISQIHGTISSSGAGAASSKIILTNPNGFMFDGANLINLNSLTVSTNDLTQVQGRHFTFEKTSINGAPIIFNGNTNIEGTNDAAFIANAIWMKPDASISSANNTLGRIQLITADGVNFEYRNTGGIKNVSITEASDANPADLIDGHNESILMDNGTSIEAKNVNMIAVRNHASNGDATITVKGRVMADAATVGEDGSIYLYASNEHVDGSEINVARAELNAGETGSVELASNKLTMTEVDYQDMGNFVWHEGYYEEGTGFPEHYVMTHTELEQVYNDGKLLPVWLSEGTKLERGSYEGAGYYKYYLIDENGDRITRNGRDLYIKKNQRVDYVAEDPGTWVPGEYTGESNWQAAYNEANITAGDLALRTDDFTDLNKVNYEPVIATEGDREGEVLSSEGPEYPELTGELLPELDADKIIATRFQSMHAIVDDEVLRIAGLASSAETIQIGDNDHLAPISGTTKVDLSGKKLLIYGDDTELNLGDVKILKVQKGSADIALDNANRVIFNADGEMFILTSSGLVKKLNINAGSAFANLNNAGDILADGGELTILNASGIIDNLTIHTGSTTADINDVTGDVLYDDGGTLNITANNIGNDLVLTNGSGTSEVNSVGNDLVTGSGSAHNVTVLNNVGHDILASGSSVINANYVGNNLTANELSQVDLGSVENVFAYDNSRVNADTVRNNVQSYGYSLVTSFGNTVHGDVTAYDWSTVTADNILGTTYANDHSTVNTLNAGDIFADDFSTVNIAFSAGDITAWDWANINADFAYVGDIDASNRANVNVGNAHDIFAYGMSNVTANVVRDDVRAYDFSNVQAGSIGDDLVANDFSNVQAMYVGDDVIANHLANVQVGYVGDDLTANDFSQVNAGSVENDVTANGFSKVNVYYVGDDVIANHLANVQAGYVGDDVRTRNFAKVNAEFIGDDVEAYDNSSVNAGTVNGNIKAYDNSFVKAFLVNDDIYGYNRSDLVIGTAKDDIHLFNSADITVFHAMDNIYAYAGPGRTIMIKAGKIDEDIITGHRGNYDITVRNSVNDIFAGGNTRLDVNDARFLVFDGGRLVIDRLNAAAAFASGNKIVVRQLHLGKDTEGGYQGGFLGMLQDLVNGVGYLQSNSFDFSGADVQAKVLMLARFAREGKDKAFDFSQEGLEQLVQGNGEEAGIDNLVIGAPDIKEAFRYISGKHWHQENPLVALHEGLGLPGFIMEALMADSFYYDGDILAGSGEHHVDFGNVRDNLILLTKGDVNIKVSGVNNLTALLPNTLNVEANDELGINVILTQYDANLLAESFMARPWPILTDLGIIDRASIFSMAGPVTMSSLTQPVQFVSYNPDGFFGRGTSHITFADQNFDVTGNFTPSEDGDGLGLFNSRELESQTRLGLVSGYNSQIPEIRDNTIPIGLRPAGAAASIEIEDDEDE